MAPVVTEAQEDLVPVHINVGGTTYTTCLDTLTRFPDSKIAKLFNGSIPISVDPSPMQQQYFLDRDGQVFRHVLNFLRCSKLVLPNNFTELDLLMEEALYYEIEDLCRALKEKCSSENNIGFDEQTVLTEDVNSVGNCEEKQKKSRKRKKSKQTERNDELKEAHDDNELANIKESNQGQDGDLAVTSMLLKNLPFHGELIIAEADYEGIVRKLLCSDEHFEMQVPTSPPLGQLVEVNKTARELYIELTFDINMWCKNCLKGAQQAYITKEGKHTCNNCNPSYNHKHRTFDCDLTGATAYKSDFHVEFPWVARCLLRQGYRLVTSTRWAYSDGGGDFHHHFIK